MKIRPKWKILAGNIGYVDMGLLLMNDVASAMAELAATRGIIFDIRNYPNATLYEIAKYLNPDARKFVCFTIPQMEKPGSFYWTTPLLAGPDYANLNYYKGDVVILCDETTQSHAEFTCMALQTAPRAYTIGSRTSGADGNVSNIYLPGGIQTYFSGIGVFYPDERPTQRVGIALNKEVRPTIQGMRLGVDEVLEAAINYINR